MTPRELSADVVLAALRPGLQDPLVAQAVEAIEAVDQRPFTVTESPAGILRKTLDNRYRSTHRRDLAIGADAPLLERLTELADVPVTGFAIDREERNVALFFVADSLEPIGTVILERHGEDQ